MNTLSVRANAVIFYALSSLIAFASLSAVTMFNHYPDVVASVTGHDIKEFGLYTYRGIMKPVAKVDLKLDLDIDLRPVFNWNAKQIFVWVMAEYHDDIRPTNQISLWDTIITDPDAALIKKIGTQIEYPLSETQDFRGKDVTLSINWDIMPHIGWLKKRGGPSHNSYNFTLPEEYFW